MPLVSAIRAQQPPTPLPPRPGHDPQPSDVHVHAPMVFVPPTFEYKQVTRDLTGSGVLEEAELNEMGAGGWELAGVVADAHTVHFYFKRETR